jgi:hypothetical protein
MAHALDDAHSVLMFGSRRMNRGVPESNIVWSYGHTTVPRHYRDVFANEYGLAATRGRPDHEIVASLLRIADAQFQVSLANAARSAGKIAAGFELPGDAEDNTPENLAKVFADPAIAGHFPAYPLGTDLTATEQRLAEALLFLKNRTGSTPRRLQTIAAAFLERRARDDEAFRRMDLVNASTWRDRISRRLLGYALSKTARG